MGEIFGVVKISNIFGGIYWDLKFLINVFFWGGGGERKMLDQSLRMKKK